MKIAVVGLWHLGSVTAACLASLGHKVIGYDANLATITQLQNKQPPIFEPGLPELITAGIQAGNLNFTHQPQLLSDAKIIWVTYDTPVDDNDIANVALVINELTAIFAFIASGTVVIISSQLPVGTTADLQQRFNKDHPDKKVCFAYSPENLRLGRAIEVFTSSERIIVGIDDPELKPRLETLFSGLTGQIVWMSIASAEMTKHALNAFLATSVVFINELASICERVGADAKEVEQGLKTEARIGPKAYLRPGSAFAGGTLARDIAYLIDVGQQKGLSTVLFSAVLTSNTNHRQWVCRRLEQVLGSLNNKLIAMLGLTYKADTDTLRRSNAIEIAQWLSSRGAQVVAYDPAIKQLPPELTSIINLQHSALAALKTADAVIIATEWPEFQKLTIDEILACTTAPQIFDASAFLEKTLGNDQRLQYYSVGRYYLWTIKGQCAIISGANQGFGFAVAKAFVAAGIHLVICARKAELLQQAQKKLQAAAAKEVKIIAVVADITHPDQMQKLVETALSQIGRIDILVANAGIYGPKGPLEENDWEQWSQAIDINLKGTVLQCRAVLPIMKSQKYGRIILLSGGGATKPMPNLSAYAASKAAVVRFGETLAEEVKTYQITVNSVAPGALNTRLLDEVLAAGPTKVGEDFYQQALKQQQQGGAPLEAGAELCLYLAAPASKNITGRLISAIWDPWQTLADYQTELAASDIYTLRRIVPEDRHKTWGKK